MKNKLPSTEKGQSLVEMALSATLLMFLMLAAIDFGFGFLYWITIRDAAQEGAIYASLHPGTGCDTQTFARVRGAATAPGINITGLTNPTVTIGPRGTNPGEAITVKVTYSYHILTPLVSTIIGQSNLTIMSSVTNTILQVDPLCP